MTAIGQHSAATDEGTARELAGRFIAFLETGTPPADLFTPDVFCDFTMPQWRLQHLISRPGVAVAARELSAAAHGHPGAVVPEASAAEVIDRQALEACRHRLRELDADLAEAQSWADKARLGRLRLEREALLREVGAATGLAGRRRRFSAADERARAAVRKAIAAALARIGNHDPALARLLGDTVHTGASCRYGPDPDRPVSWQLANGQS